MPLPDHDEFGPYRAWPQTLVQPVEGRVERLRDHLRRTPVRRPKLTNKKISYTVNLTGPRADPSRPPTPSVVALFAGIRLTTRSQGHKDNRGRARGQARTLCSAHWDAGERVK